MENLSFYLKYLKYVTERGAPEIHISGIGLREEMSPGRVVRPCGTNDRFLVFFHTPVELGDGRSWRSFPAGTVILWPDRAGHFYGNESSRYLHSWIHFHGALPDREIAALGLPEGMPMPLADSQNLELSLEKIYRETVGEEPDGELCRLLVKIMLRELKRDLGTPFQVHIPEQLRRLKQRLDAAAEAPPSVAEMAEMCHYSVSHFTALFRQFYRCPPGEYCRMQRLRRAAYELKNANLSVSEISDRTGFASIQQFSRAFRARFGISPSLWRKRP